MTFWTYMLRCSDGSYYVGHTDNLEGRLWQHQTGAVGGYTSTRRPVVLVWQGEFPTRQEAFEFERRKKGWTRAKKEALIREDWAAIHELARSRKSRERDEGRREADREPRDTAGQAAVASDEAGRG